MRVQIRENVALVSGPGGMKVERSGKKEIILRMVVVVGMVPGLSGKKAVRG